MPKVGFVLVLTLASWIVLAGAKVRSRLGVQGTRGESMLIELRDTLTAQGELPQLPPGWRAEVAIRSAGGASFSGDFVVSTIRDGELLEVALVDVSGKGIDAGTRALLLSGAFGDCSGSCRSRSSFRLPISTFAGRTGTTTSPPSYRSL